MAPPAPSEELGGPPCGRRADTTLCGQRPRAGESKRYGESTRSVDESPSVAVDKWPRLRRVAIGDVVSGHRALPSRTSCCDGSNFLREPHGAALSLPREVDGARILALDGREVFTAYVPSPRGPAFMTLIQKTFGENVTTRTWDTVRKCCSA